MVEFADRVKIDQNQSNRYFVVLLFYWMQMQLYFGISMTNDPPTTSHKIILRLQSEGSNEANLIKRVGSSSPSLVI